MKYIDSEKLIAEIDRRRLSNRYIDTEGYENELLEIIASLQQEQPKGLHLTPLNRLIQKIPSENWNDTVNNYAKKLRDCLIKEGYLKDAEVLQGYISYMNGNNVPMATMDEQEQPEVDLEKSRNLIRDTLNGVTRLGSLCDDQTIEHAVDNLIDELGLNAKKRGIIYEQKI